MRTAKHCLAILVLLLVLSYDAFPYDYTWNHYQTPFTQLVRVPTYISGTSTVYLDLPKDILNTYENLTLNLDIESNLILKTDGLEQRTFEHWSAYCSVNGAILFWRHHLRVNDLPPRQTCSIVVATKDLKDGRNTFEFSMSPTGANVRWTGIYNKMVIAYGIHKMWFSEFSAPPQEPPIRKPLDSDIERKPEVSERIKLRDRAENNFSDHDLQKMLKDRNFFNSKFNPAGNFPNSFVNNGDGTVTDKVTGLMWQKAGSPSELAFDAAGKFVQELNSNRYGGYGDWRLPTMEELCSLLKKKPNQSGRFIDYLFDPVQGICWSADENQRYSGTRVPLPVKVAFCVNFVSAETSAGIADKFLASPQPPQSRYHVRAVRTAE